MKELPGHSTEQQEAEEWLVGHLAKKLGVKLMKRKFLLQEGSWVEIDGFCESPLVLCEAWAHIGPPKGAQKDKVMADAFKLLFVNTLVESAGKRILLFGDHQAAAHFSGKSWVAQCLRRHNMTIEVVDLPSELRARVLRAQERQYR